eukprot:6020058-Amphidinium_carterae.2
MDSHVCSLVPLGNLIKTPQVVMNDSWGREQINHLVVGAQQGIQAGRDRCMVDRDTPVVRELCDRVEAYAMLAGVFQQIADSIDT